MTQKNKDKRTQYLPAVRVTAQELSTCKAHADEAGLFFSEYARHLLLAGGSVALVRSKHKKQNVELFRALSRIGSNMNQIARVANIHGGLDPETTAQLREVLGKLSEAIDQLIEGD